MIKAIIFDLNGTVLADEGQYAAAFRSVLAKLGKKVEGFPHVRGIGVKENWPGLLAKYKIKTNKTSDELASMTQEAYLTKLSSVELADGFEDFLVQLKENDILTALATSNTWWVTDKVFAELGIEDYFDVVTTAEDVSFNKPSPEIYSVTAERLGVGSEDCVVIEDSPAGIEAAHAAGMKVVGIAKDKNQHQSLRDAEMVIGGFNHLTLNDLYKING